VPTSRSDWMDSRVELVACDGYALSGTGP